MAWLVPTLIGLLGFLAGAAAVVCAHKLWRRAVEKQRPISPR